MKTANVETISRLAQFDALELPNHRHDLRVETPAGSSATVLAVGRQRWLVVDEFGDETELDDADDVRDCLRGLLAAEVRQ